MRDDGAADDLVDVLALETKAIDEAIQRRRHHVEIGEIGIERIGTTKGNAHATDHRNAPKLSCHLSLLIKFRMSARG
jgi:hypothetical protein